MQNLNLGTLISTMHLDFRVGDMVNHAVEKGNIQLQGNFNKRVKPSHMHSIRSYKDIQNLAL